MGLTENLESIRQRITNACNRSNRSAGDVTLLPVTKGQPIETIRAAADLGIGCFGENKIQEAKNKVGQLPGKLRWHMIGHLQSNKCRDAVHLFEMIQSVDSLSLAREIDKWAAKAAKRIPILLEVNVAGESSKFGYPPERLLQELPALNALPRLEIQGLMTVAPWAEEPEKVRPVFRHLKELKDRCADVLGAPLRHLSMGMSGDFEIAIEEGATIVRLGTALFGPRAVARKRVAANPPDDI